MHLCNAQLQWNDCKFFDVGRPIQLVSITVHFFITLKETHTQVLYSSLSSFVVLLCLIILSNECLPAGEEHSYEQTTYLSVSCYSGAFANLRKTTISVVVSVRMEKLGSHRTDFLEIWYLSVFRKSIEEIQVSLKYDKNNGYFTWRHTCMYDNMWLNSS
jgi:hypothetical protein